MDVAKFGGTSMATPGQWEKVLGIIRNLDDLKAVVVSAPGNKNKELKVTNLLLQAGRLRQEGQEGEHILDKAISTYVPLAEAAGTTAAQAAHDLKERYLQPIDDFYLGQLAAGGEDNCARLFAQYCRKHHLNAQYTPPEGMILTPKNNVGTIDEESYTALSHLKDKEGLLIMPGFYGKTRAGQVITFERGGSDISGAVLARAIRASIYWNYTDEPARAVHPGIIPDARQITEITYEEMRELSAGGFEILQEETLRPLYRIGIPLCLKNTNRPNDLGTWVVKERTPDAATNIIGIACMDSFMAFGLRRFGGNDQTGFGSSILRSFADAGISYGYDPTGGDYVSIVLRKDQLPPQQEERLKAKFYRELDMDLAAVVHRDLAIVTVVGQGIPHMRHVLSRATGALERADINAETGTYAVRSKSIILGVHEKEMEHAVRALYDTFMR